MNRGIELEKEYNKSPSGAKRARMLNRISSYEVEIRKGSVLWSMTDMFNFLFYISTDSEKTSTLRGKKSQLFSLLQGISVLIINLHKTRCRNSGLYTWLLTTFRFDLWVLAQRPTAAKSASRNQYSSNTDQGIWGNGHCGPAKGRELYDWNPETETRDKVASTTLLLQ